MSHTHDPSTPGSPAASPAPRTAVREPLPLPAVRTAAEATRRGGDRVLPAEQVLAIQRTLGNRATGRLLAGRGALAPAPGPRVQRVSAEVEFDDTVAPPDEPFVKQARMERGEGTSGGAHSTAFVVFLDAATNGVLGKTFKEAVTHLLDLAGSVTSLPNYKSAASTHEVDALLAALKNNDDYKNPGAVSDLRKATVLQRLMRDYVLLRNKVPGTYIDGKSGSKAKGEKQEKEGANAMDTAAGTLDRTASDPGGALAKQFAKGMWLTFDAGAFPPKDWKAKKLYAKKAEYLDEVARQLANHVLTTLLAYPALPEARHASVVRQFLKLYVGAVKWESTKDEPYVASKVEELTGVDLDP